METIKNEKKTQVKLSYNKLKRLLLYAQLNAGQRLGEVEWAQNLHITRGALRESMGLLAHEGLLNRGKKGGFFVPTLTKKDIDKIIEIRVALELGVINMIKLNGKAFEKLPLMLEACESMNNMRINHYELGFAEADRRFHELLIESSNNALFLKVYKQAPLPLTYACDLEEEDRLSIRKKTLDEHRKLCELLKEKQFDKASALLEKHLMTSHSNQKVT